MESLREAFTQFDTNRDGEISAAELGKVTREIHLMYLAMVKTSLVKWQRGWLSFRQICHSLLTLSDPGYWILGISWVGLRSHSIILAFGGFYMPPSINFDPNME